MGKLDVVYWASPELPRVSEPLKLVLPSKNCTVPPLGKGLTGALNITDWPKTEEPLGSMALTEPLIEPGTITAAGMSVTKGPPGEVVTLGWI
jgi:hypothetical protein